MSDNTEAKDNQPAKQPIPRDVSGVAYVTNDGLLKYCTTGEGRELPKDFKEWARTILEDCG